MRTPLRLTVLLFSPVLLQIYAHAQVPPEPIGLRYRCFAKESNDKQSRILTVLTKRLRDEMVARFGVEASAVRVKLKRLADTEKDMLELEPGQVTLQLPITVIQEPLSIPEIIGELQVQSLNNCELIKNYAVRINISGEAPKEIATKISLRVQGYFKPLK